MKVYLQRILILLVFGIFTYSFSSCASIYNPKKNKKEQQKIRHKESEKKSKVINKVL